MRDRYRRRCRDQAQMGAMPRRAPAVIETGLSQLLSRRDPLLRRKRSEGEARPATLGTTAKAHLLLHAWCKACRHTVDLDPDEKAPRYGGDLPLLDRAARLRCAQCGGRGIDSIVRPRRHGGLED
jgi:hypothetical protein